jgi:hypothetical protein
MFVLRSTVAALTDEIAAGTLIPRLIEQFRHAYGHAPGPAEVRSWERSIPAAIKELRAAGLDALDVLLSGSCRSPPCGSTWPSSASIPAAAPPVC